MSDIRDLSIRCQFRGTIIAGLDRLATGKLPGLPFMASKNGESRCGMRISSLPNLFEVEQRKMPARRFLWGPEIPQVFGGGEGFALDCQHSQPDGRFLRIRMEDSGATVEVGKPKPDASFFATDGGGDGAQRLQPSLGQRDGDRGEAGVNADGNHALARQADPTAIGAPRDDGEPAARRQLVFAVEGGGRAFLLQAEAVEEAPADAVLAAQRRGDAVAGNEPENLGGSLGVRSRQCRAVRVRPAALASEDCASSGSPLALSGKRPRGLLRSIGWTSGARS